MPTSEYDGDRFVTRQQINLELLSVPGTVASNTDLIRIPITDQCVIDKVYALAATGGTSAGLKVQFGYSLAGTGTIVPLGTLSITTVANQTPIGSVALTSQAFGAGDVFTITNLAGTVASTPVVNLNIGWKELFNNANA